MDKETIKKRIKALLAKTTENGASENEAIAALNKAKELMVQNFISEHELQDPFASEKCVFKTVDMVKSAYDLNLFLGYLAQLFDCQYYYNAYGLTFFGFEQDTELCVYFYSFITRSCLAEKEKYMESAEVKKLKSQYHGRKIACAFIHGFMDGICMKMDSMYKERNRKVEQEAGLIVRDKIQKVTEQFQKQNIKIRCRPSRYEVAVGQAFLNGQIKGEKVSLITGLNATGNTTLALK